MADDINDLAAFNNSNQSSPEAQGSTLATQPPSQQQPVSDVDQLAAFNQQSAPQEEPSAVDQVLSGIKEGAEAFERGAIQNAKNVTNAAASFNGLPEPFETPPGAGKAELESLANGLTLGASRLVETGILHNQEDQARRAKDNPDLTTFANAMGGIGLLAITGGSGSLLESLGLSGAAKAAVAGAIDTAGLSAGQIVSDQALGDPDLNAQKLASALWENKNDIGLSALFGAGLGLTAHGLSSALTKSGVVKDSVADIIEKNQAEPSQAQPLDPTSSPVEIDPTSPQAEEYQNAIKKTNLAEMEQALAKARAMGLTTELPQKSAVIDAESRLGDLQLPLNQIQVDSLDSQAARDQLGILKQLSIKGGGTLADFEAAQKAERLLATDSAIKNLAPGAEITSDLHEAGQSAIKAFTDNYQAKQEALAPLLNQIKSLETENPFGHQPGAVQAMANRVPGVSMMFDTTEPEVQIKPYSTSWGIDKATYTAVSQAYKALEEPSFIQELMNVRQGLEQNINIQQAGKAAAQIRQLKAGMMDYIQQQIAKVEPNLPPEANVARETLRDWAINEQQREVIEKAFGVSVGTPEFTQLSRVNPEKILDKVFSDTSHVKAAKQILSESQFNEMTANYLAGARKAVTTDGAFSSNKFNSFLNRKRFAINEAMASPRNMQIYQRINDLNTTMRNFPDAGPTNNSKTAQGILHSGILRRGGAILKNLGTGEWRDALDEFKDPIFDKFQENAKRKAINQALQGNPQKLQKMTAIKKMTDETDEKISAGIRHILIGGEQFGSRRSQGGQ